VNVDGLRLRTSLAVGAVGQSRIPKAGAFACNARCCWATDRRVCPPALMCDRCVGIDSGIARVLNFRICRIECARRQPWGRRACFTSRAQAQASATGPTCPSLSGLTTARIVWICPPSTSSVNVPTILPSRS
jgi:hypothetical protein